uniref:Methyltransferase type 11 domain-containing protein n=1 Tax=Scophthalmus maximus TaxID=52904 RepID=A0A8D2ZN26_SCOMX
HLQEVKYLLCWPMVLVHAVGLGEVYKRVFPFCVHRSTKKLFHSLQEFNNCDGQLAILEIGCSTGINFEFYPPGCKVICTDPNPHYPKYLDKSMSENDHLTYDRFVVASGEDMGSVPDRSVDVVCTLMLCSVNNIQQTLNETHRVLRRVSFNQIWKTTKQHFNSPDTFPNVQLQIHIDFLSLTSVLSRVILNNKHTELIFISYLYLPWPSCSICYLYFNGSTFSSYSFHIVILFQHCSHVCFVLSLFCCCFTIVKYSLCIR